jgi:hypothetical protein
MNVISCSITTHDETFDFPSKGPQAPYSIELTLPTDRDPWTSVTETYPSQDRVTRLYPVKMISYIIETAPEEEL